MQVLASSSSAGLAGSTANSAKVDAVQPPLHLPPALQVRHHSCVALRYSCTAAGLSGSLRCVLLDVTSPASEADAAGVLQASQAASDVASYTQDAAKDATKKVSLKLQLVQGRDVKPAACGQCWSNISATFVGSAGSIDMGAAAACSLAAPTRHTFIRLPAFLACPQAPLSASAALSAC